MNTILCIWAKPSRSPSLPTRRPDTTKCSTVLRFTNSTVRRSPSNPFARQHRACRPAMRSTGEDLGPCFHETGRVVKQLVPPLKQRLRQLQPSPQDMKEDI